MENDTSDEAYQKWYDEEAVPNLELLSTISTAGFAEAAWQECRRRTFAMIDHWMTSNGYKPGTLKELLWQIEDKRREAFEAGWLYHSPSIDEGWEKYNDQRRIETTPGEKPADHSP